MLSPIVRAAALDELGPRDVHAILRLRVDVFVVEQRCPYPEIDGRDLEPATVHLWVPDDEPARVLAYLRILLDRDDGRDVSRIGRVCTAADARKTGLGDLVMRTAMERIGSGPAVLDAQVDARGFYERFGFRPVGETFLEDGIPHVTMVRPGSGILLPR